MGEARGEVGALTPPVSLLPASLSLSEDLSLPGQPCPLSAPSKHCWFAFS